VFGNSSLISKFGVNGYSRSYIINHKEEEYGKIIEWTPLMFSASCGNIEIINLLLSKGASKELKDKTVFFLFFLINN
jgi:hypothetical protein